MGVLQPPSRDQVIALAGLFQACSLVDTLARTGQITPTALETAITSLLEQNPKSCEATFGSIDRLTLGFQTLEKLLSPEKQGRNQDMLRYVLGLIFLQHKVWSNRAMLNTIAEGVTRANQQARHFGPTHETVISGLAELYTRTISSFRFRIQVNGQAGHLQQNSVADRVRCLLFAGIRAGILWRQTGGRRWHLIVYRKHIQEEARKLRLEC